MAFARKLAKAELGLPWAYWGHLLLLVWSITWLALFAWMNVWLSFVGFFFFFLLHASGMARHFRASRAKQQLPEKETTVRITDCLEVYRGKSQLQIAWPRVTKLEELSDYWALWRGLTLLCLIPKHTISHIEDFEARLRSAFERGQSSPILLPLHEELDSCRAQGLPYVEWESTSSDYVRALYEPAASYDFRIETPKIPVQISHPRFLAGLQYGFPICAGLLTLASANTDSFLLGWGTHALSILFLYMWSFYFRRATLRSFARFDDELAERIASAITPTVLISGNAVEVSKTSWESATLIAQSKRYIQIFWSNGGRTVIPKEDFASETTKNAFLEAVSETFINYHSEPEPTNPLAPVDESNPYQSPSS